jgi:hypothetical protein
LIVSRLLSIFRVTSYEARTPAWPSLSRHRARRPGRCESIALVIPQFRSTRRPTAQAYY